VVLSLLGEKRSALLLVLSYVCLFLIFELSQRRSDESLIDLQTVYTFERTLSQGVGNHLFGRDY
jgi:hypothetical protein